jgi:phosphoglycolate phosphatase-like HAD superfamily hydrolase
MAEKWHIITGGQRQVTTLAANGTGFQDVVEVTYQIDSGPAAGNTFTIRIPAQMYNADHVQAVIDRAVAQHNEIAGL